MSAHHLAIGSQLDQRLEIIGPDGAQHEPLGFDRVDALHHPCSAFQRGVQKFYYERSVGLAKEL